VGDRRNEGGERFSEASGGLDCARNFAFDEVAEHQAELDLSGPFEEAGAISQAGERQFDQLVGVLFHCGSIVPVCGCR